ncbi:hypothetical protein HGM15179_002264, partial [Zosterops borbonicus]
AAESAVYCEAVAARPLKCIWDQSLMSFQAGLEEHLVGCSFTEGKLLFRNVVEIMAILLQLGRIRKLEIPKARSVLSVSYLKA